MSKRPSPEERALAIASKVDRLFHRNQARWKEQCAVAMREAPKWPPDANAPTQENWPGRDPTLAAMYLTLAVLHDGIGEGWGKILDSTTADSGAVKIIEVNNFDDGEVHCSIQAVPDLWSYSTQGVGRLKNHLNAVLADLEANEKAAGKRPTVKATILGKEARSGGREPRQHFTFATGQALYKNRDLGLPAGLPVTVLQRLVKSFGRTVPHRKLHGQSHESEASEELREAIRKIRRAFKRRHVPHKVQSKRTAGYLIQ